MDRGQGHKYINNLTVTGSPLRSDELPPSLIATVDKSARQARVKVKGVRSPNTGLRTSLRSGELRHGKLSAEV
jgi:hypothetical protein